jgi:signal transduction histidine kinase
VEVASWWWHLAPELHARMSDNIDFTASLTPGLTVLADRAQLSQIFTHLVSNARDAMPRGGRLQVTARSGRAGETFAFGVVPHAERFVYFAVEDSGSGMSDSVLTHIFDPLFTTKQNAGTGLGLAFAHQAVAAHGGQIFAESTFGAGSTFHVFIPHACLDFEHHNDCGDPT